jgi:hypothetical protein
MLNAPLPYVPSQPPGWGGAGGSARPGPWSATPPAGTAPSGSPPSGSPPSGSPPAGTPPRGVNAGSTPPDSSSAAQAAGPSLAPQGPIIGVAGYFAFGASPAATTDTPASASGAVPGAVMDGKHGSGAAATPSVNVADTNVGSDLNVDPTSGASSIASSAGLTQPADEQRSSGKNSPPSAPQSSAKTGANSGVRQPTNNGNAQSGLKRENPFE